MKIPRAAEIAALVQPDRVHRDVYLRDELFALERKHFFANTWNYLGHASQVPAPGDYLARNFDAAELDDPTCDVNGTSELLMRNQFRAWAKYMTLSMRG